MSQQQTQTQALQQEEARRGIAQRLMEMLGLQQPQQAQPGMISGVNFEKLVQYILSDRERFPEEDPTAREIKEILTRLSTISREYIDTYVRDGISRVIHPLYGGRIIDARLSQIALLLRRAIRLMWKRVIDSIRAEEPPEEVFKRAQEAEAFTTASYMLLVEIYAKMLTIYHINAPAKARPPLANIALGYDLLS